MSARPVWRRLPAVDATVQPTSASFWLRPVRGADAGRDARRR
jgi:hypothetical protein